MPKKIILHIIRGLFTLLFLYAGIIKFIDFRSFSSQLIQSPFLKPMASWLEWLIPVVELAVVLLLFSNKRRLQGLYAIFGLMLVFTIYLVLLTYFTDYISCDCGGFLETIPPAMHIILNTLLTIIALWGIWLEKQISSSRPNKPRSLVYR